MSSADEKTPPVLQEETGTRELVAREIARFVGPCREENGDGERCGKETEYVLWGKLFPAEALGPRCYDCAAKHVAHMGLASRSGWALVHIRHLARHLAASLPSGDGERGRRRRIREYDPANPWKVGDRLEYVTTDADDKWLCELDGTAAEVLAVDHMPDLVRVKSIYGERLDDPYCFVQSAPTPTPTPTPAPPSGETGSDCKHGVGRIGGMCRVCMAPVAPDEAYLAAPPAGETGDGRELREWAVRPQAGAGSTVPGVFCTVELRGPARLRQGESVRVRENPSEGGESRG